MAKTKSAAGTNDESEKKTRVRRPWGGTIFVRPDRPGTLWARWKDSQGKTRVANTRTADPVEAERFLAVETGRVQADVERGVREITARDFATDIFLPIFSKSASPLHVAGVKAKLVRFYKWTGSRPLHAITRSDIERFLALIQEKGKDEEGNDVDPVGPATVHRYAMALSAFFRSAVDAECALDNPVRGAKRPQVKQYAPIELTPEDVDRILSRADEDARPALTLLADLGLRCGELLSLTWAHVAKDGSAVTIARSDEQRRGTKSGESRTVPVPTRSREILAQLRAARVAPMAGPDLVFPQIRQPSKRRARTNLRSKSWIESAFREAAKKAGFPVRPDAAVGVRPHDLRHAYSSALARNGVALSIVAKLIGDSIAVTESRYAHHVPDNEAVRAVATLERRPAAEGTPEKSAQSA